MGLSYFLFPFEKIEKGAKIIIYGAGEAGQCFWNQIQLSEYGKCEALIDINYKRFKETSLPVYGLDYLKTHFYDYIVISIEDSVIAEKAANNLLKLGIDENKIIISSSRRLPPQICQYNLEYMLDSLENTKKVLSAFFEKGEGGLLFYKHIQRELKDTLQDNCRECYEYIKKYLCYDTSVRRKILLLRLIYGTLLFDSNYLKKMIEMINDVDDTEAAFWLLWDVSTMELYNSKFRYPAYYQEKRNLNLSLAERVFDKTQFEKVYHCKKQSINRTAIVVYTMRDITDAHMQLVISYANEMVNQGKEVAVFFTDLLNYSYGACFIRPIYAFKMNSKIKMESFIEATNNNVKAVFIEGETIKEKINDFMIKMAEYAPGVIFDMSSEYSYISPLFSKYFPTVCISMRGYCTSSSFHKFISRDKETCIKENRKFPFCKEEVIEGVLICNDFPSERKLHKRKDYGLNENDFVLITVGSRLGTEISLEMAEEVCTLLRQYKNIRWLIVGVSYIDALNYMNADLIENRQIIMLGHESDLMGLYKICDVYVNPIRMGGGTSIAWAMRQGLPIAILDVPADIVPRIGRENLIKGGYKELAEYLRTLYLKPDVREKIGKKMIERTNLSSKKESVKDILRIGDRLYRTMNGEKS